MGGAMSGASSWSHQARWSGGTEHVSEARQFVQHHLARHGLSTMAPDASLVISELATNAVLHAETPFTVILTRRNGTVTIAVQDLSPVLMPVGSPTPDHPPRPSGRGLEIVQALSSAWGVIQDGHGKSVWASFPTGD